MSSPGTEKCAIDGCQNIVKRAGKKFCSQTCMGLAMRTAAPERTCPYCRKPFKHKVNTFCSSQCAHRAQRKEKKQCEAPGCSNMTKQVRARFCSRACQLIGTAARKKGQCEKCGQPITTGTRFCSRQCAAAAKAARGATQRTRTCPQCKKAFVIERRNRPTTYCSVKCYSRAKHDAATKTCARCGEPFLDWIGARTYCNKTCAGLARRAAPRTHTCPGCGATFQTRRQHNIKYCTPECAALYAHRHRRTRPLSQKCAQCGNDYDPKTVTQKKGGGWSKFCSRECAALAHRKRYDLFGANLTVNELAELAHVSVNTIRQRLIRPGRSIEDAICGAARHHGRAGGAESRDRGDPRGPGEDAHQSKSSRVPNTRVATQARRAAEVRSTRST